MGDIGKFKDVLESVDLLEDFGVSKFLSTIRFKFDSAAAELKVNLVFV